MIPGHWRYRWKRTYGSYEWFGWRAILTDSTVWTSKLDYTVAALISRKSIKSMIYMIAVIYDFDLKIYVIQYDTWSLYGIWMFVCYGVIHWVATHINRKIFSRLLVDKLQVIWTRYTDRPADCFKHPHPHPLHTALCIEQVTSIESIYV